MAPKSAAFRATLLLMLFANKAEDAAKGIGGIFVAANRNGINAHLYDWIVVAARLTKSYLFQYMKSPFKYNFLFWASRVAATIIKLRKKEYV